MIGGLADDLGHALHYDTVAPPSAVAQQLYDNPVPGEVERNPLDQLGRSYWDIRTGVAKSLANTVAKGYGAVVGKDYVPFPKPFEGADPQSVRFLSHASDLGRAAAATPAVKLPAMAYDYVRKAGGAAADLLGGPKAGGFTYGLLSAMPDAFADGGLKGEVGEVAGGIGDAIEGAVKDAAGAPQTAAGGSAALPLMQLAPEHAQSFSDALSAAKAANPWGDRVYQYPTEDYSAMKMFMTPDQKSGYAIKPDGDIVSVFKHPESPEKGFGVRALNHAVQNGGTKLDAFDTELPKIYAKAGFQEYARTPWDDAFAPPNWDYQKYGQFNGGKPDVVYMVHPQAGLARYMAEADPSVLQYSQRTGKTELPIVYHGTASPENFKGFDIRDNAYYDPHHSGYNGFVAEDHNFASDYANNGGGGGIPNLEALAAAGHEGLPAGPRVLPMRFGPRKLYDPRTPEGQQVATDWFSSPEGRALYDTNPRLRERLLGDYYHGPGSMLSPEQRQAYVDQNLFAHHVANPQANWVPMEIPEFVDHLRSKGYDAAALREAGAWNYGLLDPGAVKSSVGNVGTYDRSNPDLLKADGGAVTPPVSAFRAAYPGANPAYGTKPVVVNGKTLQVSADPDIVARAREAMQRLQDQMSADSARRAAGLGVPSSQYGQKPQYADGGLAAKYGVTRIAFADGGLKGELGEVASGIGDAITGAVKDTVGTPQVAAAADIPRVFGTIRNSVGATPNALRAAGVPDDMARSMAQAAQTDTLGPKQINEALRARESYLAEPNVTPGPQASDDAWRQWGEQHGVNMTVTPHQEIAPGIRVPGGTGGTFTIPDLFDMKANTFDVKNLTPEQHEALMQKMIRTYGTADDPVNAYNRLVFSQMSPKAPLLTNEFLASRVRARTPEDLFAHAAGTGDVGKQYGLQSAGAGGMGLRGTPDPNATRQLASVLSENPSLVKAAPGETTRDVALRLMNQVPLFSQKTASLGAPLLDLANGSTSPVDLHVIRNNWRQILEDPQYGPDFKQSLAKKFGVEPTTDAITAAYDAAPGKGLDTVRSVVEQKTNGKYRLKGGELNPRIPDAITPDRLGTEPDMFQDFGPLYDRFSKQLENDRIGNLPLFANQWAKWDGYRGRFEPHEVLHPDYVNLPKQSFQEMRAALQANRAAGFADESGFREGHGLGWKDLYYGQANPDLLKYLALGTGVGAAGWKAWNNAQPDPKQNQSPAPSNGSIERTSRVTGLPQSEVVKRFVNGTIPMYAAGGPARG